MLGHLEAQINFNYILNCNENNKSSFVIESKDGRPGRKTCFMLCFYLSYFHISLTFLKSSLKEIEVVFFTVSQP